MKKLLLAIVLIISIYSCGITTNNQKWKVSYLVDEFGDKTSSKYVKTKESVWGKFSNSATDNSKLKVQFVITKAGESKWDIGIDLYEYGDLKVKALSYKYPSSYLINIKHNATPTDEFWCGKNSAERMYIETCPTSLENKNWRYPVTFLDYLTKGGKLQVSINEYSEYGGKARYRFELNTEELDLLTALKQL